MEIPAGAPEPGSRLIGRLAVAVIVVMVLLAPFLFDLGLAAA